MLLILFSSNTSVKSMSSSLMCPVYSSSYSTTTLTVVVCSFLSRFFSVFSILANHPYYCTGYYVDRSDYSTGDEDFAVLCYELFHLVFPSVFYLMSLLYITGYKLSTLISLEKGLEV